MNRITPIDPAAANDKARELFDRVQAKLGAVPNLFRVLGNAPAALEGYLNLSGALAGGTLNARVREQVALAVAESNLCEYCLSAHSFVGGKVGLSEQDIADARRASAAIDKTDAILKFARSVVVQRGEVSDETLKAARASGLSDGEIVETVANVALNIFTNYVNHVARTVVDFPVVSPGETAATAGTCSNQCDCEH